MAHEMRDLRAPNLVLAGHAIDVRTRTADVPALHDGGPPPHSRHMSRQQLSTRSDEPRCTLAAGRDDGRSPRLRSHREALAHQHLRYLPEALGVVRVERVRLDPVERIRSVVHSVDPTVLEIEPAAPFELRCGRREHGGRGAGIGGLELHDAGASRQVIRKWPRWFEPNCSSKPSAVLAGGQAMTPALLMRM